MVPEFDYHRCFPGSYAQARERFIVACRTAGAGLEAYENDNRGPDGKPLTTDVARFGPRSASRFLILVSGTHGNEGRCGSGCQVAWVREGGHLAIPDDTAVLLVHYINPYGGANLQRDTEENVDLNRNFIEFETDAVPENREYDELHPALICGAMEGEERRRADAALAEFKRIRGEQSFLTALARGQYTHPKGLFFGGLAPTWANRTLRRIVERHCQPASKIAVIDYHTGVGPYGYGMLVTTSLPDSESFTRARRWYGESLIPLVGQDATEVPPNVGGSLIEAVARMAKHAQVTVAAIEFGTYELPKLIELRRTEAALKSMSDPAPDLVLNNRYAQERFLNPGAPDWTEMVWMRSRQVIRQSLHGLAS